MPTPAPLTGDTSNMGLWIAMVVIAVVLLVVLVIMGKKKKR
ncbi:MAG: LPXTG cell wall anchor domain-containing protein [Oscillospiraceae bacterium]